MTPALATASASGFRPSARSKNINVLVSAARIALGEPPHSQPISGASATPSHAAPRDTSKRAARGLRRRRNPQAATRLPTSTVTCMPETASTCETPERLMDWASSASTAADSPSRSARAMPAWGSSSTRANTSRTPRRTASTARLAHGLWTTRTAPCGRARKAGRVSGHARVGAGLWNWGARASSHWPLRVAPRGGSSARSRVRRVPGRGQRGLSARQRKISASTLHRVPQPARQTRTSACTAPST
jgi:hypothetical protein